MTKENNSHEFPGLIGDIMQKVGDNVRNSMDGSTSIYGMLMYRAEASKLLKLISVTAIPKELHEHFLMKLAWCYNNGVYINIPGIQVAEETITKWRDTSIECEISAGTFIEMNERRSQYRLRQLKSINIGETTLPREILFADLIKANFSGRLPH